MQRSEIGMLLLVLAEQTHEKLSPERTAYMISELEQYTGPKLNTALRQLIREARRFPTIAEIETAMGVSEVSDQARAAEAAARIEGAIVKYGSTRLGGNYDRQRAFMGELAWAVCDRLGGYQHLCDTLTNDDMNTAKAQWRNLAAALCESAKRGTLDMAPGLPEGPAQKAIAQLADQYDVTRPRFARLPNPDTEEPPF